ncbi:MAG: PilT/PilU family type 4a pilus ATPase [Kiritimatiellaeota bacterium]|nr:PilT/PilU family type 4a pilus ATPase [Kiritimatiellota bacterium]
MRDLLKLAVESRASDLHMVRGRPVVLRIDGKLVDTDAVLDEPTMSRFLAEMATEEMIEKYDKFGDLDLSYVEDEIGRFRVNVHRQRGEAAFTLRHVKNEIMHIDQIGVPMVLKDIAESERGIIILTGTTGSGKSTTLAAMLEHVNLNFRKHCITIEDPIEYEFEDKKSIFEQREVGIDTESFRFALIHSLRQDPDIIMVGEMRDKVSFDAALQAADTGHLVLSTLHATNAAQAITRILDFYEHHEQESIRIALSMNLRAIISQRLIPKAFGGGVTPAVEIMINTPLIRKLLERNELEKLSAAIGGGKKDRMQTFNQSLMELMNEGLITEEDALKTASNPEALKMAMQGIDLNADSQILN